MLSCDRCLKALGLFCWRLEYAAYATWDRIEGQTKEVLVVRRQGLDRITRNQNTVNNHGKRND